jgi:hypothetical protein
MTAVRGNAAEDDFGTGAVIEVRRVAHRTWYGVAGAAHDAAVPLARREVDGVGADPASTDVRVAGKIRWRAALCAGAMARVAGERDLDLPVDVKRGVPELADRVDNLAVAACAVIGLRVRQRWR